MTKLLQDAFTMVSAKFSKEEQDRFAHLIINNINSLYEFLENESEERSFDSIAVETVKSEKIQNMLGKVTDKYRNRNTSDLSSQ